MESLTAKERIRAILRRQPVDRVGIFEEFWEDTFTRWKAEGHIPDVHSTEDFPQHFSLDMEKPWPFNFVARVDVTEEVVEETAEVALIRNGDGALFRRHKLHASAPQQVDFLVKGRRDWEEHIRPFLTPDASRIDFESYRALRQRGEREGRFVMCSSWNVFQVMANVCGYENMLVAMALDPQWIREMVTTYSRLSIALHEILFEQEGLPDGLFLMEDLGFKAHPFLSVRMFRELIQPAYLEMVAFARSRRLPVLFHSCGYVEPLIPALIETGIDCLTALEVKAGMDLLRLYRQYGEVLSFMGGIDARVIASNDRACIDQELEAKLPVVKGRYGFILSSDHSIPDNVEYETYQYFRDRGLDWGKYG